MWLCAAAHPSVWAVLLAWQCPALIVCQINWSTKKDFPKAQEKFTAENEYASHSPWCPKKWSPQKVCQWVLLIACSQEVCAKLGFALRLCPRHVCASDQSYLPIQQFFTHSVFTSLNHHRISSFPSIQPGNTAVYVPDQHVILSPGLTTRMLLHILFDTDSSVLQEKEKPQTNKTA